MDNDDQDQADATEVTASEYRAWLEAIQQGDVRIQRIVLRDEQGRITGMVRRPLLDP